MPYKENGKPFATPILTKREPPKPPVEVHCAKCNKGVESFIVGENNEHGTTRIDVACHGAQEHFFISTHLIDSFRVGSGSKMRVFTA